MNFLAYLVLNKKPTEKVIIISSDKDFNQLIGKDVKINNPRKDEMIHHGNCKELFGYSPEETVDYLSMVGDTSDDIKGIPGIGPVKARKILDEYGTLDKFLEHHHPCSDPYECLSFSSLVHHPLHQNLFLLLRMMPKFLPVHHNL